ncbi:hypothetical protein [Hyphococcus sp.]|uniref:hypothetical protein n=1 Tax=Hyphococcus sp. TaxID=2038636 RepID=UPI002085E433|nr:MAG: hypothetical protein DHS20C04_17780 [Marinicaulis sp.]
MRNFLAVLGGILVLLIVMFIGAAIYMGVQLGPAQEEAKTYVRESIFAIASDWSADEVYVRASDKLKGILKEPEVIALMQQGARTVGGLNALDEIECSTNMSTSTGQGKVVTAECTTTGSHQRGSVDYTIAVEKRNDTWSMNAFHYNVTAIEETATEI